MLYDEKSYELASYFLDDEPKATEHDRVELAERIQAAVEDYIDMTFAPKVNG